MAGFGGLDTVVDLPAMNEVCIFAGQYKQEVEDRANTIIHLCKSLTDDDSFTGGASEAIKDNLNAIANSCVQLQGSLQVIIDNINTALDPIIKANKESFVQNATDATKKATKKVGAFQKQ